MSVHLPVLAEGAMTVKVMISFSPSPTGDSARKLSVEPRRYNADEVVSADCGHQAREPGPQDSVVGEGSTVTWLENILENRAEASNPRLDHGGPNVVRAHRAQPGSEVHQRLVCFLLCRGEL
jgi:hypothetical protein